MEGHNSNLQACCYRPAQPPHQEKGREVGRQAGIIKYLPVLFAGHKQGTDFFEDQFGC